MRRSAAGKLRRGAILKIMPPRQNRGLVTKATKLLARARLRKIVLQTRSALAGRPKKAAPPGHGNSTWTR